MKFKIAASMLPYIITRFEEGAEKIARFGFEAIEIYLEGMHKLNADEIKNLLSVYDFKGILVHAPFFDLNIASLKKNIVEESKREIVKSMEIAKALDAELVTAHFGRYSVPFEDYRKKATEINLRSAKELCKSARELGVKLCFENQIKEKASICCELSELKKVFSELEQADAGLTLDIGHANTCGDVISYIRELSEHIEHFHFHDNSKIMDDHRAIGDGSIDYKAVLAEIKKIKYKKIISIEVAEENSIPKSKENIEKLIKEVFKC